MKKTLRQLTFLLALIFAISKINAQSLSVTLNSATLCNTSNSTAVSYSITNTYTGTTAYSFSINSACGNYNIGYMFSTTGGLFITCTGPYTLYCSAIGSNTNIILSTAVFTGTIFAPSISISPNNGSACLGTTFSVNLSGNGASNFTTFTSPGMMVGTQTNPFFAFTPTASSCFTILSSISGCTSVASRCYTINAVPNVTTAPLVNVCSSVNNTTLFASGATSYTWSNGNTSNIASVSANVPACYTVTGSSPGCNITSSAVACVSILPSPTITVAGLTTTCFGTPLTYTASGANSYTWLASSVIANQTIVSISSSNCFIVNGHGSNGCMATTGTICPNTLPGPNIMVSSSVPSICNGGSTTLTAIGATSYTWSNSSNNNSIVVSPTTSTCYSISATNTNGCVGSTLSCVNVSALPNVTVTPTINACIGAGVLNIFANGASSYTWYPLNITNTTGLLPLSTTLSSACYTVVGSNACGTSSAVMCTNMIPTTTLSIIGSPTMCGSSAFASYTALGASNFTWFTASGTISNQSVCLIQNNTCYNVIGSGSNVCNANTGTICVSSLPGPSISIISSSNSICSGNSITLTASGANSFTWQNNGSTSHSIVVNPVASTVYTVIGVNSIGCTGNSTRFISVNPSPNVLINGSVSACAGSNIIYSASGANTYTWSNSVTGYSTLINSSSSNCYTVIGTNAIGCIGMATKCFTSLPIPNLLVNGNNSVCIGSSVTFTANGGTTYTWSTGANTNTLNVLPTSSTNYTVSASHALNACTNSTVVSVTVLTTCAIVWPGDANRDGQVDNTDVFELGLAANSTGAARSSTSNAWAGQFASAWTGTVSSGWNKVHADCNGNGVINAADTLAISLNYSLTHTFKSTNTSSGIDLFFSPQNSEVYSGLWNVIDIILGDANNAQSQIYGAAFDLDFDKSMVENDSVKLVYNSSFLNAGGQNIEFKKSFFNNGKLYTTSVRTNQSDVSGNGKIAELWVKLRSDIPDNSSFNFGISNGKRTNANGVMGVLNTSGGMNLNVNANATGIKEKSTLLNAVRFYPNPANNSITLRNELNVKTSYRLFDLTGRMILSGEFNSTKILDVSDINKGIYIIEFETPLHKIQKKLVKE